MSNARCRKTDAIRAALAAALDPARPTGDAGASSDAAVRDADGIGDAVIDMLWTRAGEMAAKPGNS